MHILLFSDLVMYSFTYFVKKKQISVCDCMKHLQLSKEVWKLNFRQYGQMSRKLGRGESQKGENQRGRTSEERRCRCENGRKVAKH